ncbi:hypothetical protein SERLA73DRAFT_127352 [Serpula lacrymans var. lacrymans S7.3]|uniref:Uncharacterized protein n=1 Tax=Serpula lacrymans var. lacrymans (strain S7.3) TaxID=936435 RepID=F8QGF6_SERL3|nr:hypothetical protein SERLA73DRAFT_127352 [Serpula lacrymans var. lacrymans S7.3]
MDSFSADMRTKIKLSRSKSHLQHSFRFDPRPCLVMSMSSRNNQQPHGDDGFGAILVIQRRSTAGLHCGQKERNPAELRALQ